MNKVTFIEILMDSMLRQTFLQNLTVSLLVFLLTTALVDSLLFFIIKLINYVLSRLGYGMHVQYLLMKYSLFIYTVFSLVTLLHYCFINLPNYSYVNKTETPSFSYMVDYHSSALTTLYRQKDFQLFLLLLGIWLLGFLFFFLLRLTLEKVQLKKIMKHNQPLEYVSFELNVRPILEELHLKRKVTLYVNDTISTPFSIGIRKATIVFPYAQFSEEEIYLLLKHELTHIQSRDIPFKTLMCFISGLHWYNPIIQCFANDFYHMSELSCDEQVLKGKSKKVRSIYAHLLLNVAQGKIPKLCTTTFSSKQAAFIERRIRQIVHMATKTKLPPTIVLAFVLFYSVTVLFATSQTFTTYDTLAAKYGTSTSIEEESVDTFEEYENRTETMYSLQERTLTFLAPNRVDTCIKEGEEQTFASIYLEHGSSVRISLSSDYDTDCFCIGIGSKTGQYRYVQSKSGMISYTFEISENSSYSIFLKNQNLQDDVHLTGTIYIQ